MAKNMFDKIFLEITNVCNLSCSFCPGTVRKKQFMDYEMFKDLMIRLQGYATYLYFHLMGEPLLHPDFIPMLHCAKEHGFRVILTTNGTLLAEKKRQLLDAGVFKISISLHCYESNCMIQSLEQYLQDCFIFCDEAAQHGTICVLRLWNEGGADQRNQEILQYIKEFWGQDWQTNRSGFKIKERIFLEYGERFDWPSVSEAKGNTRGFCYALRDQIGILCDGTVVPCCMDSEGALALGNVFSESLEEILKKERAKEIFDGFTMHMLHEDLCKRCDFSQKFKVNKN